MHILLFLYVACLYGFRTCFKVRECCSAAVVVYVTQTSCIQRHSTSFFRVKHTIYIHINPKGKGKCTKKVKKTIRNMPLFSAGLLHALRWSFRWMVKCVTRWFGYNNKQTYSTVLLTLCVWCTFILRQIWVDFSRKFLLLLVDNIRSTSQDNAPPYQSYRIAVTL